MRKLVVQEFVTIDGFAAAHDGALDFMPAGGRIPADLQIERDQLRFMSARCESVATCGTCAGASRESRSNRGDARALATYPGRHALGATYPRRRKRQTLATTDISGYPSSRTRFTRANGDISAAARANGDISAVTPHNDF